MAALNTYMATVSDIIHAGKAAWFGPVRVDPDHEAACDRWAGREAAWYGADQLSSEQEDAVMNMAAPDERSTFDGERRNPSSSEIGEADPVRRA